MVPDPKDPQCCEVPECPLTVGGNIPSTAGYLTPAQPPSPGTITGSGLPPTPMYTPTYPPGYTGPTTTLPPLPPTGCFYKGTMYRQVGRSFILSSCHIGFLLVSLDVLYYHCYYLSESHLSIVIICSIIFFIQAFPKNDIQKAIRLYVYVQH